ncbi:MAG: efflux RND transporter periplasmic adaptor subunit [Patescibacteria group bacterium]|jgi:HlyD family secretion protein
MNLRLPGIFKKRWFWFLFVLVFIFGGYFAWQNSHKKQNGFETYEVKAMDLEKTVTASGGITATNIASLKFQTGGRLAWVGVKKGDRVRKWQAIASLDQRELEKTLKKTLLAYNSTRMDFDETSQTTYKDTALTESIERIYQKNQNALDAAVVDVELADLAKQYATLYSPIDGIVIKATDEHAGVNISLATTEYVVVDPNSLQFSANVEELDIGLITVGQSATINLDAFPENSVASSVGEIEFTATQTTTGNTAFTVNFPIPVDSRYLLGMNGDVEVVVDRKSGVIAVPVEAVRETETARTVTILREDKTQEEVVITTGLETDEYFEVTEGLQAGDTIILP